MATRPFPITPELTAVAIAYRNPDVALIADAVLPRTPTKADFKYLTRPLADGFTVPNALVGRKSTPTEIETSLAEVTAKVVDYGFDDLLPVEDLDDQDMGLNLLGDTVGWLTNLLNLAREQRAATLVFAAGTFNSGLRTTLSGTSQWSDRTNSNPLTAIAAALDLPPMRPNIAVFGQQTWTQLRMHPAIVQAVFGTAQTGGIVSRQAFADLFELQEVLIGQGFVNSAKAGQTASLARVWGKHAAFLYRDRAAGPQRGVTFGFTAETGGRIAGQLPEPEKGLRGSVRVRVGERVKEVVTSDQLGYFFQDAVA